jgi:hypothetical protein
VESATPTSWASRGFFRAPTCFPRGTLRALGEGEDSVADFAARSFRASPMSQRAHFWLRIVGLTVILAAEFAPRLWAAGLSATPSHAVAQIDRTAAR